MRWRPRRVTAIGVTGAALAALAGCTLEPAIATACDPAAWGPWCGDMQPEIRALRR